MSKETRLTTEQFIKAIPGTGGIVTGIAKRVGCTWHTARKWIDNYPTVRQAWDAEREAVLDLAEGKLIEGIKGSDLGAIKYYLSTQGKRRGYVERQEVTGAEGEPLHIRVVLRANDDGRTPDAAPGADGGS